MPEAAKLPPFGSIAVLDLNVLVKSLFSSLTILALLGYLGREVINIFVGKNLELFKQKLSQDLEIYKQKLNQEIENVKSKLTMMTTEHQVKFSRLHQERAELIKQLYSAITQYESYLSLAIMNSHEFHDQAEAWKGRLAESIPSILTVYNYNKIYFSKTMCGELDYFLKTAEGITNKIMTADRSLSTKDAQRLREELMELVDISILPLKADLERDFRVLLGVE